MAGVDVVNENNPRAWVVLNIIYVMGLLSFAAVLGILTDDIGNAVDRVRGGDLQHGGTQLRVTVSDAGRACSGAAAVACKAWGAAAATSLLSLCTPTAVPV
jgi:hypothetical protein